ncbi:hypothetical protein DYI25_16745 [Mesobacillus boroniphilus]|uniref:Uncharacterized protein n=1 Tax=Mesobacillus boroniphilus TaxID=308892 RepID=A0A944GXS5_9BACI|nr:hypothetical protein [Mesobacillus boroniphilus]
MIGGAILSPNPTANSVSVAEEEDEACVTSMFKSPQGCYLLASGGFFVLRYFRYVDYLKIQFEQCPCKEILDA